MTFAIVCATLACESAPSPAVVSSAALVAPDAGTRGEVPPYFQPDADWRPAPLAAPAGEPEIGADAIAVRANGVTLLAEGGAVFVQRDDERHLLLQPAEIGRARSVVRSATGRLVRRGGRGHVERGSGVDEWYEARGRGLEQGWTIDRRLAGSGALRVSIALGPDVEAEAISPDRLALRAPNAIVEYGDLAVTDARGREIAATLAATSRAIEITVGDADASYPLTIDPLIVTSRELLLPIDGAFDDRFGVGTSVWGDVAAVGDPDRAATGTRAQGAVHVFFQDGAGGWGGAYIIRVPRPASGGPNIELGASVDLWGNILVIGAPGERSRRGAIYVVDLAAGVAPDGVPRAMQRLDVADAPALANVGRVVAVARNRIVAGTALGGRAYTFFRATSAYAFESALVGATADLHGVAVDVDPENQDLVVVGAPAALGGNGRISIYRRTTGAWPPTPATLDGTAARRRLGTSVAASGGRAAAGAIAGTRGQIVLFTRAGATWSETSALSSTSTQTTAGGLSYSQLDVDRHPHVALARGTVRMLGMPNGAPAGGPASSTRGTIESPEIEALGEAGPSSGFDLLRHRGRSLAMHADLAAGGRLVFGVGAVTVYDLRFTNGTACSSAANCASGSCVDGVCCNTACGGGVTSDCQVCSRSAGGTTDGECGAYRSDLVVACRPAAGPCDVAEVCTASSTACPADAPRGAGHVCRASSGPCDAEDLCDGSSIACVDRAAAAGTPCRAIAGPCDVAETCDGTARECPANSFAPSTLECRASAGPCDVREACSGSSPDCPANAFVPEGTVCRASGGECGVAESCTGHAPLCPPDYHAAPGTLCGDLTSSPCDLPDTCGGADDACRVVEALPESHCFVGAPADEVAPPIEPSVVPDFIERNGFLYRGQDPIATVIEAERASGVFGYVRERGSVPNGAYVRGAPIAAAAVMVLDHPEYGTAYTDSRGRYDILVNGGETVVIEIRLKGRIPVQRTIAAGWSDFFAVDPVVLVPYADGVPVAFPVTEGTDVVSGPIVSDARGTRTGRLIFPSGTGARSVDSDGVEVELGELEISITELTVDYGEEAVDGPDAMPAPLPPSSGYTYAVEIAGRGSDGIVVERSVVFDRPVPFYVDDVGTGLRAGMLVPMGSYDRERAEWIAQQAADCVRDATTGRCASGSVDHRGRVIAIVGESGSPLAAEVDLDGDGTAEGGLLLEEIGMTLVERQRLAQLYDPAAPGEAPLRLWRIPIDHMTPWDANFPYGPPDDAEVPEVETEDPEDVDPCASGGSVIQCESQTLEERVPIAGTDLTLHYTSERTPGRRDAGYRAIEIALPLARGAVGRRVQVAVAGQRHAFRYAGNEPRPFVFRWDGLDAFGREVDEPTFAYVSVCNEYVPQYQAFDNFARFATFRVAGARFGGTGGGGGGGGSARPAVVPPILICAPVQRVRLGARRNPVDEAFGWGIDAVHFRPGRFGGIVRGDGAHDPSSREVQLGTIDTVVDARGRVRWPREGATTTAPRFPSAVGALGDGSVLYASSGEFQSVMRVDRSGGVTLFAGGPGDAASTPDGAPRTSAIGKVLSITQGHEGDTYLLESITTGRTLVRRIDRNGVMTRIAGSSEPAINEEEPADARDVYLGSVSRDDEQSVGEPTQIAAAPDGSLYLVELGHIGPRPSTTGPGTPWGRLRHIDPAGVITTVLEGRDGGGRRVCSDPDPASDDDSDSDPTPWNGTDALGAYPTAVAVSPSGAIYVAFFERAADRTSDLWDGCVVRIRDDGTFMHVTSTPEPRSGASPGDRTSGTDARGYGGHLIHALAASDDAVFMREIGDVHVVRDGRVYLLASDPRAPRCSGEAAPPSEGYVEQLASLPGLCFGSGADTPDNDLALAPDGAVIVNTLDSPGTSFAGVHRISELAPGARGPNGEIYEFDVRGRHVVTRDATTGTELRRMTRDASGQIVSITDASGNVVGVQHLPGLVRFVPRFGPPTEVRSGDRWAETIEYAGTGRVWRLTPTTSGLLRHVVAPDGAEHDYIYDPEGRLIFDDMPEGRHQLLAVRRDATNLFHREVRRSTASGLATTYERTGPAARERRRIEQPDGTAVTSLTCEGHRTDPTHVLGASGRCDGEPDPLARTTRVIMPDGASTETVARVEPGSDGWHDAVPALTTLRRSDADLEPLAIARSRTRTEDAGGALATETWTTTVTGAGGASRTAISSYDAPSRTLTVSSPLGRTSTTVLDGRDRPIELTVPGLHPFRIEYDDSTGRVLGTYRLGAGGAREREWTFRYTDPDQPWAASEITEPDDPTTAPVDRATNRSDWGSFFQLSSVTREDRTVSFGYESSTSDRVTSITPPGRPAHGMAWLDTGDLERYLPPALSGAADPVVWDHDRDGRVRSIDHAGRRVDLGYDPSGRLETVTHGSHALALRYHPSSGELERIATEDGGAIELASDGPLPSSVTWSGPVEGAVRFGHDELWQRERIEIVGSPTIARYSYDADGAPECVTIDGSAPSATCASGLATRIDPIAREASSRYPGTGAAHVATELRWSALGEPTSYETTWEGSAGSGELTFDYRVRDHLGRLREVTETSDSVVHDVEYTYDQHGRLTDVERDGAPSEHYEYDRNGNRTRAVVRGVEVPASLIVHDDRDRLLRYGSLHFTYNAQGQLETRTDESTVPPALTRYEYDALGSLRRVELADGRVIAYRIDGLGRRIERSIDGTVTHRWLYLDGVRPIAELDGANRVRAVFLYGTRRTPDLVVRGSAVYRLVTDHLGSVRRVIDVASGATLAMIDYDAFGVPLTPDAFRLQPFGFAGGIADPATGLVRFGARDYDPAVGEWTTPDPVLLRDGLNLREYVGGDPVNFIDPRGANRIRVAIRIGRGLIRAASGLSRGAAFSRLRGNGDVWVRTAHEADELARAYSAANRTSGAQVVREVHRSASGTRYYHYHAIGDDGARLPGHIFYGDGITAVLGVGGGDDGEFDPCAPEASDPFADFQSVLDFVNPLDAWFGITLDQMNTFGSGTGFGADFI